MFDVKFIEALAYAMSREVVIGDEYYKQMTSLQRKMAVSIAGLAQLEQVKYVINEVNKCLDGGGTFADFQKAVKAGTLDPNLPRHRLDNIFRTNIQSAYSYGRWTKQQENKDDRPYLMYDAINDSRTRPTHRALDGVIRHIDDPFWDTHYAPLGYRCRCSVRALTEKQAKKRGVTSDDDLPDVSADEGFGQSPKDYTDSFNELVAQRIKEMMIDYYPQAKDVKNAYVRIQEAVTAILSEPIVPLATLEKEAEKVSDTPDEYVNLSNIEPKKGRVEALMFDPAREDNSIGEAQAMALLEVHYDSQSRRFTKQEVIDAGSKKIGDFLFISGAMKNTKLDLMFTTDDLSKESIDLQNQWFVDKNGNLSKQIKASIQKHLEKDVDIIPLDLRVLSAQNQALLIAYIESLAYNDRQRFIFLTNGDNQ